MILGGKKHPSMAGWMWAVYVLNGLKFSACGLRTSISQCKIKIPRTRSHEDSKKQSKAKNSTRVRRVLVLAATARQSRAEQANPTNQTAKPCQEGTKTPNPLLLPFLLSLFLSALARARPNLTNPRPLDRTVPRLVQRRPCLQAPLPPSRDPLLSSSTGRKESRGAGAKGRENSSRPRGATAAQEPDRPEGGRQGGVVRAARDGAGPAQALRFLLLHQGDEGT